MSSIAAAKVLGALIGWPEAVIEEVPAELRFACLDLVTAVAVELERREVRSRRDGRRNGSQVA